MLKKVFEIPEIFKNKKAGVDNIRSVCTFSVLSDSESVLT